MLDYTVKEKLLLHLRGYGKYIKDKSVPEAISQKGIAEALAVSKGHISKVIHRINCSDEGLLKEKFRHIDGLKRKRKVYFLTSKGIKKSDELKERLVQQDITVSRDQGIERLSIGEVLNKFDIELVKIITELEDDFLDLQKLDRKEDSFVGREEELKKLKELYGEVTNNNSINVFISGKAGIGKTRLVKEFRKHVFEDEATFLEGRSFVNSADPYLPIKEALNDVVDINQRILTKIENEEPFNERKKLEAKRNLSFQKTADLISEISENEPLVIFLDDLHWADKASVDLLYYLMNRIVKKRVMFIITYRTEDVSSGDPLKEMLQKASREKLIKTIELNELSKKDTSEIMKNVLKTEDLPEEFVDLLNEKALGNPLFIKECIFQMLEEGIIDVENDKYPRRKEDVKIPRIINDIITRRIDKLDENTKSILEIGCVVGNEVPYEVLFDIVDMDEMDLINNIESLLEAEIWTEEKNGEILNFVHTLISETVYDGMSDLKKKTFHNKVAGSIEKIYDEEIEEHYTNLAEHNRKAEKYRKGLDYYVKAGRYARSLYANENALDLYEKAIELFDKTKRDIEKSDIYNEFAEILRTKGKYARSKRYFEKAMKNTDETEKQQDIYISIGNLFASQSKYKQALNHFEQGLSLSNKNNIVKCKLLHSKGWILVMLNEYDKAEEIFKKENKIANDMGSKLFIAKSIHDIGIHAYHLGEYEKAIEILNNAVKTIEDEDEEDLLSGLYNDIGIIYRRSGYLDKSFTCFEKSLKFRIEKGDQYDIATTLTNLGLLYIDKGKLDEALEKEKESLEIWKKIDNKDGIASSYNNIGIVYSFMGDPSKALNNYEKSLQIWRKIDNKYRIGEVFANIGNSYRKLGNIELSKKYIKESLRLKEEINDQNGIGTSLDNLGNLLKDIGKIGEAIEKHKEALKLAEENGLKRLKIRSYMDLSKDHLELDKIEDAYNYIIKANEELEKLNIPVLEPEAKMLRGRCQVIKGNQEKGEELLEKALKQSKKMGMDDKIEKSVFY